MNVIIILSLTIIYHFLYRILVGELVLVVYLKKGVNYNSIILHEFNFEKKLYAFLKVKQWKNYMVTAKPNHFNIYTKSPEGILKSMLIAENVHIICFILSYLPLLFTYKLGIDTMLIVICFLGSLIDLAYVIIQRYNIPRVRLLFERRKGNN